MVLIPGNYIKPNITQDEVKAMPLVNEYTTPLATIFYRDVVPPEVNYETLWTQFKNSPEAIALVSAIVEDILSDGYYIEGGRNQKLSAEKFLRDNYMKELLTSFLFDVFVTGDGYIYKAKHSKAEVKAVFDRIVQRVKTEYEIKSDIDYTDVFWKGDEDIFTTRKLIHVPSSTMKLKFDEHGDILAYKQYVGKSINQRVVTFTKDEIVHFRLMRLDGKMYGFTPLQSILDEMSILADIKDLAGFYFSHGGVPNFLFNLEDETPESPNYKKFVEQLKVFQSIKNKYKNMVVTGKVNAVELNRLKKDMEFRELAAYITQVMIMVWGVPASRLSQLLVKSGGAQRSGTESTEGYYRKISHLQDLLEDVINSQLMEEYNVTFKFNRTYKQDEIREVQIDQIKADTVQKLRNLGLINNKYAWDYLRIPEDGRGDGKQKPFQQPGQFPGDRQGQLRNQDLMNSPDKRAQDRDKQSIAVQKL